MVEISRVDTSICRVGEGAHWDDREQALLFLDIVDCKVHRFSPQTGLTQSWDTPHHVGAMALRENGGGVILGMTDRYALLDFQTGEVTCIADSDISGVGPINDGKADAAGRFVVGRCGPGMEKPESTGGLYSLGAHGHVAKLDGGINLSNSVCFSADGCTLYFADSHTRAVYAYDYDPQNGAISDKRLFVETHALGGVPDGATIDADGLIWMAIFQAGKIVAFRPDGVVERSIDVPVSLVSSVAFGGPALDRLYFTSLDTGYFGGPVNDGGGAVFLIEGLGARGIPEMRFAG